MKRLSVLFVNSWYPNEVLSQNGNFIQQHARAVSIYCKVAAIHVQSNNQKERIKISKGYNKDVYEVIVYYKKIKLNSVLASLIKKRRQHKAYLSGYRQVLKEFKRIDIVHLNVVLPAGFFALYLKKTFNIPFIVTEHSTIYLKSNPSNHGLIEKYIVKKIIGKASFICPVSKDLKNALEKYGIKGRFQIIPNVVDTNLFQFNINKKLKTINILHVSSLVEEQKNIKGILNVIKKLSEMRTNFTFQIIGDGHIQSVKEYAQKIKLENKFYNFTGQKPLEKIAEAMKGSHLFIMFSNYENLPCVIAESLVSGLPVLSSNVGGIDEMISKENGILVAARNENELLRALYKLLNNTANYNGEKIATNAISKYSYEIVGKQFLNLYNKTLKY